MKAKKLFPELTFKRLWNKITGVENKTTKNTSAISELNKKIDDLIRLKYYANTINLVNGVNKIDISSFIDEGYMTSSVVFSHAPQTDNLYMGENCDGIVKIINPGSAREYYIKLRITLIKN